MPTSPENTGEAAPTMSPVEKVVNTPLNRRQFIKVGIAIGAAAAVGSPILDAALPHLDPLGVDRASASELAGTAGLSLPVTENERDPRIKKMGKTKISKSSALGDLKREIPIEDITINTTDYSETVAQNRLDMAVANHFARMMETSKLVNGDDFSQVQLMLMQSGLPPEPNEAEFTARLASNDDFFLPIVGLPENEEVAMENLVQMLFDVKKGLKINFTNKPQLMSWMGGFGEEQMLGFSFRVSDEGRLQYDIFVKDLFGPSQQDQNETHTGLVMTALETAILTLGNFSTQPDGKLTNWYNQYVLQGYDGIRQEQGTGVFSDEVELLMGEIKDQENDYGMIVKRAQGPTILSVKSPKIVPTVA